MLLSFLGYLALVKSSLNELPVHPGVGGFYKGPNSETIIKGPDGSVITTQAEGGSVITQDLSQPIVVTDAAVVKPLQSVAPVVIEPAVTATPVVAVSPIAAAAPSVAIVAVTPVVPVGHTVEIIQPDPHIIETEIIDAPLVEPQQSSDLVGPSGSISTRGSSSIVSGPASTTISGIMSKTSFVHLNFSIMILDVFIKKKFFSEPAKVLVATPLLAAVPVISTVTTPLRAIPVVEAVNDSATPILSTVTVAPHVVTASPQILVSSTSSPNGEISSISTLAPLTGALSTTLAPPIQQIALVSTNIGASIQPASSNGVINNLDNTLQVSSTPRPGILLSSTLTPLVSSQDGIVATPSTTDLDHINNRQLSINPSLIPSANIVPPEIGPLPPGAIDLGSTVTVSTTPRTPGVLSPIESPNIQRIENGNSVLLESNVANINGGQQSSIQTNQISVQNQVHLAANGPSPQLSVGIPKNGIVGTQLANYGIDSSQIGLTNVPLSSVSRLPETIDQEIDEVSAHLWNRYGRDVKEEKGKHQKEKNKEK